MGEPGGVFTTELQQEVTDVIAQVIGGALYRQSDVNKWSSAILDQALATASRSKKGYKFIVTCVLMQKTGAGLNTAAACLWDASQDSSCTVRWENKSVTAIVHLFAVSL